MTTPVDDLISPYEALGGHPLFASLVSAFYVRVATDPILRPMYPADDLHGAEERLRMFLEQYWGGPTTYSEQRGHPRLRMRHSPYAIDAAARDRWVQLMAEAVHEQSLPEPMETMLWDYLVGAAYAMQNIPDDPKVGGLQVIEEGNSGD